MPGVKKMNPCMDHTGRQFNSFTEMCRYYGRSSATVNNRLRMGWSVEEALTTPTGTRSLRHYNREK